MSCVVLQTKLFKPCPKTPFVSRPRLLEKLRLIPERKLTLISAPAGFGKTTLLGEWLQSQVESSASLPVTWLSLDAYDNDPARFTTYFIAALQKIEPTLGSTLLDLLKAAQPDPMEEVWELLIGEIQSISAPFVLVLDDFHVIETPLIHRCLAFLLERMPFSMHMVILSRVDLPLPLARLRMQEVLIELRAFDLRFSAEEIACYFELYLGKKLSHDDQNVLEERTEGWIAGMQLAALALRSKLTSLSPGTQETSLSTFIHQINGNTRYILDYLMEEVLQGLPEGVRSFLRCTCVLDRLTAPLCDALTGMPGSQAILDGLEKNNLFLFPLDDERRWYRFHHLFADLLYSSLQHTQPNLVPALHRTASIWYADNGFITEAISHALKIPDLEAAADLMEREALDCLLRGEINTLLNWSSWISEEQNKHRPLLCVCFAWACIVTGRLPGAERYLTLARQESASSETSQRDYHGHIDAMDAMIACTKSNYEVAFRLASQSMKQIPPQQIAIKGVLALTAGSASEMIGQPEVAAQAYQESIQMSHSSGNRLTELFALRNLGDLQMRQGRLRQAEHSFQQAYDLGIIRPGQVMPISTLSVFGLGQISYEWNQLARAEQYFLQGEELARRLSDPFSLLSNLQYLARIRFILGNRESAYQLWQETGQIAIDQPLGPVNLTRIALVQVRLCLLLQETQAALRWAQIHARELKTGYAYPDEMTALTWANLWISQQDPIKARKVIEDVLPDARSSNRWGVVIKLLIMQALALFQEHNLPKATSALEEALQFAEPEGYCRCFLDEGEPLIKLLHLVYRSREGVHKVYIARLLEGLPQTNAPLQPDRVHPSPVITLDPNSCLVEPLSDRELEILQMISAGQSNQEIADSLFIAVGTVKTHVSNIYSKFGVRSRTQAMIKARQLQLV